MNRSLSIMSRLVLVLGLMFLSVKPSLTNRIDPAFIHPNHQAFFNFASLSKTPVTASNRASFRSSFHKNEDKSHFVTTVTIKTVVASVVYSSPKDLLGDRSGSNRKVFLSFDLLPLRI